MTFLDRREGFWEVEIDTDAGDFFERYGEMPWPPYLGRPAGPDDRERYQTVYARERGAVAAPTAGLHFDAALLDACRAAGAELAFVTLHVGAGTFQPVRVADLSRHRTAPRAGPGRRSLLRGRPRKQAHDEQPDQHDLDREEGEVGTHQAVRRCPCGSGKKYKQCHGKLA